MADPTVVISVRIVVADYYKQVAAYAFLEDLYFALYCTLF